MLRDRSLTFLIAGAFALLLTAASPSSAQVVTGTPPLGSFGGDRDVINLANLNSHIGIPVLHKPGRGTDFTYDLTYDSSVWYPVTSGSTNAWTPVPNWGWHAQTEAATGYISYIPFPVACLTGHHTFYTTWTYHDSLGASHLFGGYTDASAGTGCPTPIPTLTATAFDSSGYVINVTNATSAIVYAPNGTKITAPILQTTGAGSFTDRNGNQLTVDGSGHFYDTMSSTVPVLTIAGLGTSTSPTTLTYTPPAGGTAAFTVHYSNYTVATNFAVAGIGEYKSTAAVPLVTSIVLPDSSQYTFVYEPTPSTPTSCTPYAGTTCVTARIRQVILPTGGSITYVYGGGSGTNGSGVFSDGSAATVTRTLYDPVNSWSAVWTYSQVKGTGAASTTTVTDPQSNNTVIQFQGIHETQRQVYQGAAGGTLLRTLNTCYNSAASPCTATAITPPINTMTVLDQLGSASGPICKHAYTLDGFGMATETDDYDYGPTAPGALLRKIIASYATLGNIHAFTQTTQVQNGSGQTISQTTNNYDETTPTATTGTPQHIAVTGSRGNLTTTNYPVTGLSSHVSYYDTSTVKTATDVNAAQTTNIYSTVAASCGNAFPTSVNEPLSMSRSFVWNCTGGVLTQLTDENSKVTSVTYSDAFFWRPAQISFPDGGQTNWAYTAPWQASTTQKMNSTQNVVTTTELDGLGRFVYNKLTSDPLGATYNQLTYYDSLGRVSSVFNPTRCSIPSSNCGESTWGYTAYTYDALNRVTGVQGQDGTSATATYPNNTSTVTDEAGKARKVQLDALGRLTNVWEDPTGLNYQTVYTYNALDNLIGVVQNGSRNRSFAYDAMSRLLCEANPEISSATCPNPDNGAYTAGTVRYGYDSNGNQTSRIAPAPNQTGSATVTTNYTYDLLHRLRAKSYSDGTPTANFYYDAAPGVWNTNEQNTVGRLVEATTLNTATEFSYDQLGRIIGRYVCTPSNCTVGANGQTGTGGWYYTYSYNLAGGVTQFVDGIYVWPQYLNQTFDGAGRVSQLTSTANDANHPAILFTAAATNGYWPNGALRKATVGNGLTLSNVYDKRFQPCRMNVNSTSALLTACTDAAPSGNVLDLSAGFNLGVSDNGDVMSWSAVGNQTFTRSYTYDSLNRVKTMGDTVAAQLCKGLSWTYDAWGNRTNQNNTAGSCGQLHPGVNANNQLTDPINNLYTYDAAGNMTHDASHSYTYDAENHLISVDGGSIATYVYDAFGLRAKKTVGANSYEYTYDNDGNIGWEILNGVLSRSYVRSNGLLVAEYFEGTTYFPHADHLGSTRLLTRMDKSVRECDDYYPYGESNSCGVTTGTTLKFTGDERDVETNLDHTWFRQYSSSLGRWMTPDPGGLGVADLSDPQSWNRYDYVRNSPLNLIDPFGLTGCPEWLRGDCAPDRSSGGSGPSGYDPVDTGNSGGHDQTGGGGHGGGGHVGGNRSGNQRTCTAQRIGSGLMGAANLGLAIYKTPELLARVLALSGTVAGAPAAGVLGAYGTTSLFGQALAGTAQLYSAASGNYGTPTKVAQVGTILSGPVSGLGTLAAGGSLATAEKNAGFESMFTAGTGFVSGIQKMGASQIAQMTDWSIAFLGLSPGASAGCGGGH